MPGLFSGRVALVTGGSTGIGKATAIAFAREGARVVIASRRQDTGRASVKEIELIGGEALWMACDVSQADQVENLIAQTLTTYGHLDCAFNNAGSGGRGGLLPEISEEYWDQTIDGYLKSVFLCMKYQIPAMVEAGGGSIVNNSSVDGKRAFPWDPVYSAAKHGVLGLTKSVALQYATQGMRINAVCPGWIKTPPVDEMITEDPQVESMMLLHQPVGRLGSPEEVAEAVLWLCSDQASFITGTALDVDGGYLAL
jgi:NAD(P)-dependent dehydrogenase (short-subunit alcohol dehydrogenase family)